MLIPEGWLVLLLFNWLFTVFDRIRSFFRRLFWFLLLAKLYFSVISFGYFYILFHVNILFLLFLCLSDFICSISCCFLAKTLWSTAPAGDYFVFFTDRFDDPSLAFFSIFFQNPMCKSIAESELCVYEKTLFYAQFRTKNSCVLKNVRKRTYSGMCVYKGSTS